MGHVHDYVHIEGKEMGKKAETHHRRETLRQQCHALQEKKESEIL
jgi:hypothetical protein